MTTSSGISASASTAPEQRDWGGHKQFSGGTKYCFLEFQNEDKKRSLHRRIYDESVLTHEFWGNDEYFKGLRPRTVVRWHRDCYFFCIGVKTAEAVVKYRKENGPFQNLDELIKIPNVGPKRREILQQNFTLTDPDRVPSCSTRSSKQHENNNSTYPGKTSTNQSQSRTFCLLQYRFTLLAPVNFRSRLVYFLLFLLWYTRYRVF